MVCRTYSSVSPNRVCACSDRSAMLTQRAANMRCSSGMTSVTSRLTAVSDGASPASTLVGLAARLQSFWACSLNSGDSLRNASRSTSNWPDSGCLPERGDLGCPSCRSLAPLGLSKFRRKECHIGEIAASARPGRRCVLLAENLSVLLIELPPSAPGRLKQVVR